MAKQKKTAEPQAVATETAVAEVVVTETVMLSPDRVNVPAEDTGRLGRYATPPDDDIRKLAYSMYKDGQQTPIRVTECEGFPGRYDSVFGNTRTLAARLIVQGFVYQEQKIGDPEFRLRAEVVKGTPKQLYLANLTENAARVALSDMDIAHNMHTAKTIHNVKTEILAQLYNIDRSYITKYLKLMELPKSIQDRIHSGQLNVAKGYLLSTSKLSEEQMLQCIGDDDITMSELASRVNLLKNGEFVEPTGEGQGEGEGEGESGSEGGKPPAKIKVDQIVTLLQTQVVKKGKKPNDDQSSIMSVFTTAVIRFIEADAEYDWETVKRLADKMNRKLRELSGERSVDEETNKELPGSAPLV